LAPYYLTGLGLKLRAHPLAVALALQQLEILPDVLAAKRMFASLYTQAFGSIPFLNSPDVSPSASPSWYAYNLRFDAEAAGCSREEFVEALQAEGLVEVDIPNSTRPLHREPLFTNPAGALPRLYDTAARPQSDPDDYPNADRFFSEVIKLPVAAFADERFIMEAYIEGIVKVSEHLVERGSLLR